MKDTSTIDDIELGAMEGMDDCRSIWCQIHKQSVSKYCSSHGLSLCYHCLQMHRKCKVLPLENVAKGVKTKEKFINIEKSIHDVSQYLNDIIPKLENEVSLIKHKRVVFLKSIDDTKKKLSSIIDNVKREGLRNIEDHEVEMQNCITKLYDLNDSVKANEGKIATCRKFSEDSETFTVLPILEKCLRKDEKELLILQDKGVEIIEPVVRFEILGEQTFQISYDQRERQFQELSSISKTLSSNAYQKMKDMKFKESFVFEIPRGDEVNNINGCTILLDGRMCFIESKNKRLWLRKSDDTFKSFQLELVPNDVTVISNSEVAVLHKSSVAIVNVDNSSNNEYKFRSLGKFRHITCHKHHLIVCVGSSCFYVINLQGQKIREINIAEDLISCFSCWDNMIFYANCDKNRICSVDLLSGESKYFKNVDNLVKLPTCITSDGNGNMFIVGSSYNNIVAISVYDKNDYKELLRGISNITHPKTMAYNAERRRLLICSPTGQAVTYTLR